MKKIVCVIAIILISITATAQKKKVAVVTFYADKQIDMKDVGMDGAALIAELLDDPTFNLQPLVDKFHDKFFNDYAKKFPFELVSEATVTGNTEYQSFKPEHAPGHEAGSYVVAEGYTAINHNYGKNNETELLKIFNDVDGIMFVFITFEMNKGFGIGGTATTKMRAYTNIVLYNKAGKKVFTINENANSKKTGVMVGGVPVMKPEKLLPMCESALDKLMKDLDKRIAKITKKSDKKL
ncbi:hypothetical protein [Flavobacterium litorale]|uniref:Uncharacterized protein n=1 Tax=Flavobacterium litorale TaxID=2856519 RepID=A0ABX8V6B6_9FLAO|nr:hypothetical protein [Flavobacterium litorale]QYJ67658.1 hypothetical protein K1I41_08880 [Flavobacterium litorale]